MGASILKFVSATRRVNAPSRMCGSRLARTRGYSSPIYGIERPANYAEAIQILKDYIRSPSQGRNLISSLWTYELALHRDAPDARAALLVEINQFISDHSADGFGLVDALNFAAYQDWIPQETMEKLLQAIEKKYPNDNPRLFVLSARAAARN
jgi:hypothetical protein